MPVPKLRLKIANTLGKATLLIRLIDSDANWNWAKTDRLEGELKKQTNSINEKSCTEKWDAILAAEPKDWPTLLPPEELAVALQKLSESEKAVDYLNSTIAQIWRMKAAM